MEAATDRSYAFIPPGVWMSVYDLARCMHRTVRWVRKHVRDSGCVAYTKKGDTEFFWTNDIICWLEDDKIDPRESLDD